VNQQELDLLIERHVAWLERGPGLARYRLCLYREDDVTGLRFSGDLRFARFHETTMRNVVMNDVDLSGARCRGVDFSGAQMRNVNAHGADFRRSDFAGADLRGMNGRSTRMENVKANGADMRNADFRQATLERLEIDRETKVDGLKISAEEIEKINTPESIRELRQRGVNQSP